MKKPYQIEAQRAVRQLEEMAADGNPAVQMVLPMAEMVGWLRQGVGALIRQAGLRVMELLMEEEVRERVGERSQPQSDRTANRWGKELGFCVVMGQKVPIDRPRVRTTQDQEVRLEPRDRRTCTLRKTRKLVIAYYSDSVRSRYRDFRGSLPVRSRRGKN